MTKRERTDTSIANRKRLARRLGKQINAWMDIREDHMLAEQEIGFLSAAMHLMRLGDAGRVRYAEFSIKHSQKLLDSAADNPVRRRVKKSDRRPDDFSAIWDNIRNSYTYAVDVCDALSVLESEGDANIIAFGFERRRTIRERSSGLIERFVFACR